MPAKNATPTVMNDGLTVANPIVEKKSTVPMVSVFIPPAPEAEAGIQVDPYEHVTINGALPTYVQRGVPVEVPGYVAEVIERSQKQDEMSGAMMQRLADDYLRKTEEKTKPE